MDEIWKPTNRLMAICLHHCALTTMKVFWRTYRDTWMEYKVRLK